ncbi:M23 family metallopeptidase [Agromyces sp. NPDC060279]|uniref:M23 family metallopeptidase n=1 Tax=Agromyces sp. NPDC060279 TaxID=3347092 RepID=UPI003652BC65
MVQYQHPFSNPDLADGWGSWAGGRSQAHRGLDYPQPEDTPIPAVADGTVRHNIRHAALGWVIVIAHADGMFSGYCHMVRQSPLAVGTAVTRGQTIGNVGNEGTASQGNHLHLTITFTDDGTWNNGDLSVTTDPWTYINARLNGTTTPNPTPKKEEIDMLFLINANDTNANPANRYALVGPGFWFVTSTVAVANNLATRFGSTTGSSASVTWAEWDRAFKAAVSSGFVPASGQTSRTV